MILYAGSYTEIIEDDFGGHGDGIYCFDFNADNGSLNLRNVYAATNPSYLCIPTGEYLYTQTEIFEVNKPRVLSFRIDPYDFSLHLMNEQHIPGGLPCHINYSKKNNCIMVACYETGNIMIYPVAPDGTLLPLAKVIQHDGTGINKLRQERAHAHAVIIDEKFSNIIVTDLGIDKIMVYHIETGKENIEVKLNQVITLPPGSGPRHMVVHAETQFAFVLNELTAAVTVMRYRDGNFELLYTFQTLPDDFNAAPGAAAIRISANGKFLYISERSHNCITVLRFDAGNETLEVIGRHETMGKTPRDINLDPTGNWLLAANQDSDSIAIFKVDKDTGMISPGYLAENIKSPVCLEWLQVK